MSIKVLLSPYFSNIVGKNLNLETDGDTVKDIIENIDVNYPGFKNKCIDKKGKVFGYLGIYINNIMNFPNELGKKLQDGDEITMLVLLTGG